METLKENFLNQEACYEKAGGRANVGSNYFSSFYKRNIFLHGQAENSLMLNNDRALCEVAR